MPSHLFALLLLAAPAAGDALIDSEWTLIRGPDSRVQLRNRLSGLCAGRAAAEIGSGATVQVIACDTAPRFEVRALPNDEAQLVESQSGLCLGVRGIDRHGPGTDVEFYACRPPRGDPGIDSRWRIRPLANGAVHIRNRASDLCLGVRGVDSHAARAGVEVYHCSVTPAARKSS